MFDIKNRLFKNLLPTDYLILAALILFSLIAVIFYSQVESWCVLALKNLAIAIIYIYVNYFSKKIKNNLLRIFLRVSIISLSFAYLFGAVDKLQLIIHKDWMDYYVLDFEQLIFGVQPTLWLQDFTSKPLTEWLMFSYVIYLPLYPILCGVIYFKNGALGVEDYLFTLGIANILCDIGFILFPVASPMYIIKELYTVPLEGWFWTYLGEFMRSNLHYAGGSIPSPHAAAATVMLLMSYKYHKKTFWIILPIIISLYISTFYCRFHYVTDAVVGIITALFALLIAKKLVR